MDEVDLNLENYEELFGVALSHSEQLFENGGIDSLFGKKDTFIADSHCQGAVMAEVLSLHFIFSHVFSSYSCQQILELLALVFFLCLYSLSVHSSVSLSSTCGKNSTMLPSLSN